MQQYIETMVAVFKEVARVLMNHGTVWLNLGDTYATDPEKGRAAGVKEGDLVGIPWRVALAMQSAGWYLR